MWRLIPSQNHHIWRRSQFCLNASFKAKLIKLADKISNVNDLLYSSPRGWSFQRKQQYLLWTEQVVAGLRGSNQALEQHYDELLLEGKKLLNLEKQPS